MKNKSKESCLANFLQYVSGGKIFMSFSLNQSFSYSTRCTGVVTILIMIVLAVMTVYAI